MLLLATFILFNYLFILFSFRWVNSLLRLFLELKFLPIAKIFLNKVLCFGHWGFCRCLIWILWSESSQKGSGTEGICILIELIDLGKRHTEACIRGGLLWPPVTCLILKSEWFNGIYLGYIRNRGFRSWWVSLFCFWLVTDFHSWWSLYTLFIASAYMNSILRELLDGLMRYNFLYRSKVILK